MTGLNLNVFANPKGKVVEEYFFKFQENGDCFFLKEKDGIYSCAVYETRPGICRNYPSTLIQKETCEANRAKFLNSYHPESRRLNGC